MGSFCVIGMGRFGKTLAVQLAQKGNTVSVVDRCEKSLSDIADLVDTPIIGDATSEKVLDSIGIANYDCVAVCFSKDINASILLTLMLKEMGVKKVIVRASNEQHKKVLEKIGADMVVFPENDMGEKTAYILSKKNVLEFIEFDNNHAIAEISLPASWVGKTVIEINVRQTYGVSIIAMRSAKGEIGVTINPNIPFKSGDTLVVLGTHESLDRVSNAK